MTRINEIYSSSKSVLYCSLLDFTTNILFVSKSTNPHRTLMYKDFSKEKLIRISKKLDLKKIEILRNLPVARRTRFDTNKINI